MKPIDSIKENWEEIKTRLTYWWANELLDRAVIWVTAPKDGVERRQWQGGEVTAEDIWTNIDYMIWRMEEEIRTTYYGGESVPLFYHGWAIGHALLLGCEPRFAEDTVWTDPLPPAADGYPPIRFHREGPWWRWMQEATLRAARASLGRYFVLPTWGNHAADNLALIRGSETLMLDIAENPAWVRRAVKNVSDILLEVYGELWKMVGEEVTGIEGSVNYCGLWSPGKTMGFDCDISCCVSTEQFEELFLPPLLETMRTVDHCIYHLDGVVALHHLDLVLSIPEIQAIQWVPGAGREKILQWVPLIKRIQAAGKSVQVFAKPDEVPALLREVSPKGLCIMTRCESEQDARDLLRFKP